MTRFTWFQIALVASLLLTCAMADWSAYWKGVLKVFSTNVQNYETSSVEIPEKARALIVKADGLELAAIADTLSRKDSPPALSKLQESGFINFGPDEPTK